MASFRCKLVMPGQLKPTSAKGERQLTLSLLMVGRKESYIYILTYYIHIYTHIKV